MFARKINPSLVQSAYKEFSRSLKWRAFFAANPELSSDELYDPDYELKKKNKNELKDSELPHYFIDGLDAGERYIQAYLKNAHTDVGRPNLNKLVDISQIEEYLRAHGLLITATDKNLGAAVVRVEWLINGCENLLTNESDYSVLSNEDKEIVLLRTKARVNKLANQLAFKENIQLARFLRSKVPEEGQSAKLPNFWGLPKIHKNPWAVRPIVPCHSNMQAPPAKFVSKSLKSMVNSRPYVLKGTKDLAIDLQRIVLPPRQGSKKLWIVTADVVAMYPNTPLKRAKDIARHYYRRSEEGSSPANREAFKLALDAANDDLVFKFLDKTYIQNRGLAMGVACSPDIANLYGAFHEEEIMFRDGVPEWLLLYKRYIDDILMLVWADTLDEVKTLCRIVKLGELNLTWNYSTEGSPFLDMYIYYEPTTHSIEHRAFSKANNSLERIPYASSHPLDVKRGTFYSEMSRMSILNSTRHSYERSVKTLKLLYIGRGYPSWLVQKWVSSQLDNRWRNRLQDRTERSRGVLVLKTLFNDIWNSFDSHELMNVIRQTWIERRNLIQWCDEPNCESPAHFGGINAASRLQRLAEAELELGSHRKNMRDFADIHFGIGTLENLAWRSFARWDASRFAELDQETGVGPGTPELSIKPASLFSCIEIALRVVTLRKPVLCTSAGGSPTSPDAAFMAASLGTGAVSSCVRFGVPALVAPVPLGVRPGVPGIVREPMFDILKTDFVESDLLVSRERTTQMSDFLSRWRHTVLLDFQMVADVTDEELAGL